MIAWSPAASVLTVSVAVPSSSSEVPRTVVPSLNTTFPVGDPAVEETVARNVSGLPAGTGWVGTDSTVEVATLFTVCVNGALVAAG